MAGGAITITQRSQMIIKEASRGIVLWARQRSVWTAVIGSSCCGSSALSSGFVHQALGSMLGIAPANGITNADLIVVIGLIGPKMAKILRSIYDEVSYPKYVITFDCCNCTIRGNLGNVIKSGAVIPVDVRILGCKASLDKLKRVINTLKKSIGSQEATDTYEYRRE